MLGGISSQIYDRTLQWIPDGWLINLQIDFRHVTIWDRPSKSMCLKWNLTIFTLSSKALKQSCIRCIAPFCPMRLPRCLSCLINSITEPLNSTCTQDMESDRPKQKIACKLMTYIQHIFKTRKSCSKKYSMYRIWQFL
jgi:hypothetical protein